MFRDSGFVLQARQHPLARAARIRHRFEGGEGFGRDNKQCLGGVEIAHRFCEIGAVDIGYEAESHGALAIVLERFVGHDWPEIRSPDADIDHIADALTGMAFPGAAAQPIGKISHPVQNGVDLGDDVATVVHDRTPARRTQRDVKHSAVLRDIDLVASEHGVDSLPQLRFAGKLQQQSYRFIRDPVLGIVEIEPGGFDR